MCFPIIFKNVIKLNRYVNSSWNSSLSLKASEKGLLLKSVTLDS